MVVRMIENETIAFKFIARQLNINRLWNTPISLNKKKAEKRS